MATADVAKFLATDKVPETLFGIPVVQDVKQYTKKDIDFFQMHPEAGGYYDLGDGTPEDGSPEGTPVQADEPRWFYGVRNDGTLKGPGWLGAQRLPNGGVATEYSIGVDIDGKKVEIPTLVPSLTTDELKTMLTDVIPNRKRVPDAIIAKAADFAYSQMKNGKPVFKPNEADEFFAKNPTLFGHVKKHESEKLAPYKDVGGYAYGYGAHLDLEDNKVTADTAPLPSSAHAQALLVRDLYRRRKRLADMMPGWRKMPGNARQALLDIAMGRDDILTEGKSSGLYRDLRVAGDDPAALLNVVKKHYYSYRKADDPNARTALERRRIDGGKTFFGENFTYEGKVWDNEKGFISAEEKLAQKPKPKSVSTPRKRKGGK